jgi:multidrug efflux pump subunit AcrA (membrane-fusion protein)
MTIAKHHTTVVTSLVFAVLSIGGCSSDTPQEDLGQDYEATTQQAPTNRVAIPSAVRSNLGITFAPVERRAISDTVRAPGRFEYLPSGRREYSTMLDGQIEILVDQFDDVEIGTPLYRIDSPSWRSIQKEIAQSFADLSTLKITLGTFDAVREAHEKHEQSLNDSIAIWSARVDKLQAVRDAGGGSMSEYTTAKSTLASAHADLADVEEKHAEHEATRTQTIAATSAAQSSLELSLDSAAAILGIDREALTDPSSSAHGAEPWWRTIQMIEVNAVTPGIVESIDMTTGAWAAAHTTVVTVVQPTMIRFRASGLQSDLGVLRDGLAATIVPPTPTMTGRAVPMQETMRGTLILGPTGDADDRTVELYVIPQDLAPWARPGVLGQLEIVTAATATEELSIPLAAVQRDGLLPIIFRRAPDNPNEVIRMDADLGLDDGRWVAVLSGLRDGDEVVLDGGFQLMLATSGSIQKGGHFHSDGTFHEGEH